MKDTEIHDNLDQKELRDYFSEALLNIYLDMDKTQSTKLTKTQEIYKESANDIISICKRGLAIARMELRFNQEAVTQSEKKLALFLLTEERGWSEYDVSDYVTKTKYYCRNFIGTEKEHESFIKKHFNI